MMVTCGFYTEIDQIETMSNCPHFKYYIILYSMIIWCQLSILFYNLFFPRQTRKACNVRELYICD